MGILKNQKKLRKDVLELKQMNTFKLLEKDYPNGYVTKEHVEECSGICSYWCDRLYYNRMNAKKRKN